MAKQGKQTKKNYLTLNKIDVNAGVISWYEKELVALVKVMCKVYEDKIISLYKSNKEQIKEIKYATDDNIGSQYRILMNKLNEVYGNYYDDKSKKASESMVKKVSALLKKNLENSFYLFMSKLDDTVENKPLRKILSQFSPEVLNNKQKFIKAWTINSKMYSGLTTELKKTVVANNIELIKTIHSEYHKQISQALYDTIVNGKSQSELIDIIKTTGSKTTRRARLIARDQVNKTHQVLYRQELKQNGIRKAKWVHIGGGKTDRKTHITKTPYGLNGAIFDLSKGLYDPAVDKNIFPAELPFCRCISVPIIELGE